MSHVHLAQDEPANAATELIQNIRLELSPLGWQTLLAVLLTIYQDGTAEGRRVVLAELERMALAADIGNDALTALHGLAMKGVDDGLAQAVLAKAKLLVLPASADAQSQAPKGDEPPLGQLALQAGKQLRVEVCRSAAGYYIGTHDDTGPCTRESVEYWEQSEDADEALQAGQWTQRTAP